MLGNREQLRASLRLTQRLRCRFGISVKNVIGHNESLSSPFHFELVPSLRHQTHGDWRHSSMQALSCEKLRLDCRSLMMDFGISFFPTDETFDPPTMARMVEERGFESLFVTEHTHIPASRETPYPGGRRAAARVLAHLRPLRRADRRRRRRPRSSGSGPAICLVVERDPITTAKEVASARPPLGRALPLRRRRRLEPARRWPTTAPTRARRFGLMRERVEAMKAIWTEDEADLPRRVRRLRPDLVLAEAASSSRTRRSWSAATGRRSTTACSPSATGGSRTGSATTRRSSPGSRSSQRLGQPRPGATRSR